MYELSDICTNYRIYKGDGLILTSVRLLVRYSTPEGRTPYRDTEEAYEFLLSVASNKNSEVGVESWIGRHLEKSAEDES